MLTFIVRSGLLLCLATSVCACTLYAQEQAVTADEKEILRITQELLDAVVTGDKEVWNKYMTADGFITEEDGVVRSKAEQLQFMRPLTKGYKRSITLTNPVYRQYENTAVLCIEPKEQLEVNGQTIHTSYNETDVFIRTGGAWRLLSSHVAEILSVPEAVKTAPQQLTSYTGTYQLAPEILYEVFLLDGKLMGQRTGRTAQELLAESGDVFFTVAQLAHRKIFRKDENGTVVSMTDRRAGNDLVWKKIR